MEKPAPVPETTGQTASPNAAHLNYLDGLRGVAALLVCWNHALLQVDSSHPIGGTWGRALQVFSFGRYAVDLFIVLSGFCLMLPIARRDGTLRDGAWKFFQRRAWRILPTYFLALAFSAALGTTLISQKTGTHWDASLPVTLWGLVSHALLIHDAVGEYGTVNLAFWSIAVEWRIYFLFPLLIWLWHRCGGLKTTVIAVVSSYLLFFACLSFDSRGLTAYYIGLFALGMLGASIAFSPSQQNQRSRALPKAILWPWVSMFLTAVSILVSYLRISPEQRIPYYFQDGVIGLWSMSLLIVISRSKTGFLNRVLSFKPLTWIGTFAYSLYLIHAPLLQLLWQYVFVPYQNQSLRMFGMLFWVGTPLIIAGSYGFFLLCERPFLRRKAKSGQ